MQLSTVDYTAPDALERLVDSLIDTGFCVLKNHPIPKELVESIYRSWQAFFDSGEKHEYFYDKTNQDGFFPLAIAETAKGHTKKDIKEYYHIYPWGRIPAGLKEEVMDYYHRANAFATRLLSGIQRSVPEEVVAGLSMPLSEMIEGSDRTLLRVLHYPPMTGEEEAGAVRAAAHSDINLLTVLPASNQPGLQVRRTDGNWIDVPCDFGYLIVNAGDMLQEATGGYFPSTIHRVINPTGRMAERSRISLPTFLHPRADVVLSERYTAGDYLEERLRELGVK
ncbi:isopenicillin N synthase family dioxygenase [Thioalkalivibrio sp. HK1]|uniref:isopenicillin N synthase family dioxygenase n=1 Tax=Thioalkalivibrio sp. HK1 TaxID=1469245 RepID=UPI0004724FA9|nr:2OG-Fe(II) oxygenase family protein [Thioalkalivibrio sp. HK1]